MLFASTIFTLLMAQSHSFSVTSRHGRPTRTRNLANLQGDPSTSMARDIRVTGTDVANHQIDRASGNMEDDGSRWRIWSVIEELESNGLSSKNDHGNRVVDVGGYRQDDNLNSQVIQILRQWGETWAGQSSWHTLLNKKSLLHEVEESIVALQFLSEWLEQRSHDGNSDTAVTLVDVCCGKGILSMLASYLFRGKTSTHISSIIMLDKQQDINWNHIIASNATAVEEDRPIIKAWGGCNLHDIDEIVDRLERYDEEDMGKPLALVGIHLCKQLSPSCAGVANALGEEKCPFLCLAPCCLPRVVSNLSKSNNNGMLPNRHKRKSPGGTSTVTVRRYESMEERQARMEANQRRGSAKKRTFADIPCYLCSEIHPIHKCNLLPPDEDERLDIFQKAAALNPCWKCGQVGHFRKDCPSTQQASKPRLTLPPTIELDVASILERAASNNGSIEHKTEESKGPFEKYTDLLATSVQRDNVKVLDVGLVNNSAQHNNRANHDNWNRDRKSMFIVASAS